MGLFDKITGKDSQAIQLSKQEAFAAIAIATVASDGNISQEEVQRTVTNLTTLQFFRKSDLKDINNAMNRMAGLIKRRGSAPVMEAIRIVLGPDLLETAFFIAADLALADGLVEAEKKLLEELQHTLRINEATASKIIDVALIKNRA